MNVKDVSIAGANSLLGQHLLARLHADPGVRVVSLHDRLAGSGATKISDSGQWSIAPEVASALSDVPLVSPGDPARASILLSFLPDDGAAEYEAQHLARGTRVVTHCEHARLTVPLALPGVVPVDRDAIHLSTPNCTTAICALPLRHLHDAHGVRGVTITTLQGISGTDLPGMPAWAIHDRVVGHLAGEADALGDELGVLFGGAFAVDTFATRVPVWRGHTITMTLSLGDGADAAAVRATLSGVEGIAVTDLPNGRDRFSPSAPLATITSIRDGAQGVLMVLKGDNLEAATTGVMQGILSLLRV